MKRLNFNGVESITTDVYYDIINGYFTNQIEDENTKKELQKAIVVINELKRYLSENDLIG